MALGTSKEEDLLVASEHKHQGADIDALDLRCGAAHSPGLALRVRTFSVATFTGWA